MPPDPMPPEGIPPGYGAPQPPGYGALPPGYGMPPAYGAAGAGWSGPPLASWGQRVGAALLDTLLIAGIFIVFVIVGAIAGTASDVLGGVFVVVGYLSGFAFYFWQLWVQGKTGQTIGKKQLHISVLREQDGQPIGGGLSIARYFVHYLDSLPCGLGYLWPLWDAKRQTFADKILQTVVIKV